MRLAHGLPAGSKGAPVAGIVVGQRGPFHQRLAQRSPALGVDPQPQQPQPGPGRPWLQGQHLAIEPFRGIHPVPGRLALGQLQQHRGDPITGQAIAHRHLQQRIQPFPLPGSDQLLHGQGEEGLVVQLLPAVQPGLGHCLGFAALAGKEDQPLVDQPHALCRAVVHLGGTDVPIPVALEEPPVQDQGQLAGIMAPGQLRLDLEIVFLCRLERVLELLQHLPGLLLAQEAPQGPCSHAP